MTDRENLASSPPVRYATIVCLTCKVEITGRLNKKGELRACRSPNNDAPRVPGYCMACIPFAKTLGKSFAWDTGGLIDIATPGEES